MDAIEGNSGSNRFRFSPIPALIISLALGWASSLEAASGNIKATDDYVSIRKGERVRIYERNNDSGYNKSNFQVKIVRQPKHASRVYVNGSKNLNYTPARGFVGRDTLVYRITDGSGSSADAAVTIDVGCNPCGSSSSKAAGEDIKAMDDYVSNGKSGGDIKATDDYVSIRKGERVRIYERNNDSGYNKSNFQVKIVRQPKHASRVYVNGSKNLNYTPARGFVGRDSLVYRITDGSGSSADAVVTVDVGCNPCGSSVHNIADSNAGAHDDSTTGSNDDTKTMPTTITLRWKANPDVVDGYVVNYGPSARAAMLQIAKISIASGRIDPSVPYHVVYPDQDLRPFGLAAGDTACFTVQAYNASGNSKLSDAVCGQL